MTPGGVLALAWILQVVPEGVGDAIGALPDPISPTGLAMYGAGVLGTGGVSYALRRRRRRKTTAKADVSDLVGDGAARRQGPGTTVRTAGSGETHQVLKQTTRTRKPKKKKDYAFVLPGFVPLSKGIRSVTHDEIHAIELGILVGLIAAWLRSIGRTELTVSLLAVFVAGTLGYKRYKTKAFKTVRLEPWYALVGFGAGAGLGYLLFVAQVALPVIF